MACDTKSDLGLAEKACFPPASTEASMKPWAEIGLEEKINRLRRVARWNRSENQEIKLWLKSLNNRLEVLADDIHRLENHEHGPSGKTLLSVESLNLRSLDNQLRDLPRPEKIEMDPLA